MDATEAKEWRKYHGAIFPQWRQRILQVDNRDLVIEAQDRILKDIDFEDAKRASDDMAEGTIEKPMSYEDHVFRIRDRAGDLKYKREAKPVYARREEAYRCLRCKDSGLTYRASQKTIALARQGEFDSIIDWFAEYVENILPYIEQANSGKLAMSQYLEQCSIVEKSMRPRPTTKMWSVKAVNCDCEKGSQRQGEQFSTSLDCHWDYGKFDFQNLIAAKNFNPSNFDLTQAVSDYNLGNI